MDLDQLIDQLQLQGELLARSASQADPQAAVPSCPGWTVAAVVGHTTKVHRWVSHLLRGGDPDRFSYQRPAPELLLAEFGTGLIGLLTALREAPDSLAVHTLWPAASARLFWARRQAHETAMHRVDVQLAVGYGVSEFEPAFAADGVDELLMGMAPRRFSRAGLDRTRTVAITPLDANVAWTLRVSPAEIAAHRSADDDADLNVFGLACQLYRWVWNRAEDHEVSLRGDLSLADLWHRDFTVESRRAE